MYLIDMKNLLKSCCLPAVLFLAACSADELVPVELLVSSSVQRELAIESVDTRSTLTQNQGNFDDNQKIGVYALTTGAVDASTPKEITASSTAQDTGLYWPVTGANIDIYGWYPFAAVSGLALNNTAKTFDIQANQSTVASYRASDLMFAKLTNQNHAAQAKQSKALSFAHKLSRVQVVLSPNTATGVQATDLADAKITIANVVSRVKIESLTAPTVTPQTGTTTTLTLCENYNTSTANAYAIVPPQTMTGKTLTVALKGGATLTAALPTSTLAANGAYKYTVTVAATQLTVTASITKWGDETSAGSVTGYY